MLSEYSRYIQMLRNGLIQNGIEFSEGVDIDLSDYNVLFKLGNKIDDILLYFRLLAVGGDEDSLKGFPVNLEKTNRDILNALFRKEFVSSVLPDYQSLVGIPRSEALNPEGNESDSKKHTTEGAIEIPMEDPKGSEKYTDGGNFEYVSHGVFLDEDCNKEQSIGNGSTYGILLDEEDIIGGDQSEISLDREVEYVPHGVMLDDDNSVIDSERVSHGMMLDDDNSVIDSERVSHGMMLDELSGGQDDESEEEETWGFDEDEEGVLSEGDEEVETPWGEDEEEVFSEEDEVDEEVETPWGEDEEEVFSEEGVGTSRDFDDDESDVETPWNDEEEETETPWNEEEEETETPWNEEEEETSQPRAPAVAPASVPVEVKPKDRDLGDVLQDAVNDVLTKAKRSMHNFLYRKDG